jgi:hypothetical protein
MIRAIRVTQAVVRAVAAALVLVAGAAGCGPGGGGGTTAAPPGVPVQLAGVWNLVTERGNAFSYDIATDGRYIYVGLMRDDSQQYTLQENGTVAVQAEVVVFTPQHTTLTRTDPTLAEPTWTTSPARPPRRMTWSVSGRTLTMVEDGSPTSYQRE